MNNKMMQGRLLELLRDGVAVRLLGVSELRPEPTSAVHTHRASDGLHEVASASRANA